MIIRLLSYILYDDGQYKLFAAVRGANLSKESPTLRIRPIGFHPQAATAENDNPPEISCLLNIFMIFRGRIISGYRHNRVGRQQRFKIASGKRRGDEAEKNTVCTEMAAFEFIQSAGSVIDGKPRRLPQKLTYLHRLYFIATRMFICIQIL